MKEVVACLEEAGFPSVCPQSRAARLPDMADESEFLEWPVFSLPLSRHIDSSLEEWRQKAAQTLLDAGYREFYSKIEISAHHSPYCAAEHTLDGYSGIVLIEFMNGITRYTPDEIAQTIAKGERARIRQAEYAAKAKAKRDSKSLDKGLRKAGLID